MILCMSNDRTCWRYPHNSQALLPVTLWSYYFERYWFKVPCVPVLKAAVMRSLGQQTLCSDPGIAEESEWFDCAGFGGSDRSPGFCPGGRPRPS